MTRTTSPLRILLAGNHKVIREGTRALIERQFGWHVCGMAGTSRAILIIDDNPALRTILSFSLMALGLFVRIKHFLHKPCRPTELKSKPEEILRTN